jgi:hypothetical protein
MRKLVQCGKYFRSHAVPPYTSFTVFAFCHISKWFVCQMSLCYSFILHQHVVFSCRHALTSGSWGLVWYSCYLPPLHYIFIQFLPLARYFSFRDWKLRIESWVISYESHRGQNATETGFSTNFHFLPLIIIPCLLYTHSSPPPNLCDSASQVLHHILSL